MKDFPSDITSMFPTTREQRFPKKFLNPIS